MFPYYLNLHSPLSHGTSVCNSFSKTVWEVWSAPQGQWIISSEIISNCWPAWATLLLFQKLSVFLLHLYPPKLSTFLIWHLGGARALISAHFVHYDFMCA